jgi:transposase
VGLDISQSSFEVNIDGAERSSKEYPNDRKGIARFLTEMAELQPKLILMEATGGYEEAVALALDDAGFNVGVFNPRRIRDFAKAEGYLAATDKICARVIALFGMKLDPTVRPLPTREMLELRHLMTRRSQVMDMITREKNRLGLATGFAKAETEAHIAYLEDSIKAIDQEARRLMASVPEWQEKYELLQTAPGVGHVLAAYLVAFMPELGETDCKEAAALVGLAPFNRDSGKLRGQRHIWGGRRILRKALYMPAMTAMTWNPQVRALAERLDRKNKDFKVKAVACMRKLLTILNAMVRDRKPFKCPDTGATPQPA